MGNVGGDPASMSGGALTIHQAATKFKAARHALVSAARDAAGSAGSQDLAAAAERVAAALGTVVEDTGAQIDLAGRLAANAAEDLRRAGGQ
ncbi:MAG TPA: hypothetical protein VHO29_15020 [Marmoricola sp.]|nr:hypothetical protein [Marmoricola sp.]